MRQQEEPIMLNTMLTVPNQRIIKICPDDRHEEKPYGIITRREQLFAGYLLNDKTASHILYYYFAINQDAYTFALSPSDISRRIGITKKQYRQAIKKLKDTGYLTQSKEGSNIWNFRRVPDRYASVDFPECENTDSNASLATIEVDRTAPEGTPSIPIGADSTTPEDTEILQDNTYILQDNTYEEQSLRTEMTELDDFISRKEDVFIEKFGHLENSGIDLLSIRQNARGRRNEKQYFNEQLDKLIEKYSSEQIRRIKDFKREYAARIDATLPMDFLTRMKVKLILERLTNENGAKHGIWITGWNDEEQCPNFVFSFFPLPNDIISKLGHTIDGIPNSYWRNIRSEA